MGLHLHPSASKGRGRRSRRAKARPMSEINVTPMVDVMLVLLIVFMVAAPLLTVGVPIELPKTAAKSLNTEQKPVTVSVTPDGQIYVDNQSVTLEQLVPTLDGLGAGADARIYVRGDASANYGAVMRVMGLLSGAGYSKIGLITEQAQGTQ